MATNATFLKNELVDGLSPVITCSPSAHASFPLTNLYDNNPQRLFKPALAALTHWIKLDFGSSPQAFNGCGLVNHNIPSTGYTIKIQANATDSWGSPTINQTITHRAENTCKLFTNSTAYRWWRLLIQESSGFIEDNDALNYPGAGIIGTTPLGGSGLGDGFQLQLGELVLGSIIEAAVNPPYSQPEGWKARFRRNEFEHGADLYFSTRKRRTFRLQWADSILSNTNLGTLFDLWEDREGPAKPLLFIPDPGGLNNWTETSAQACFFGRFNEQFSPVHDFANQNMVGMDFDEISNGETLA